MIIIKQLNMKITKTYKTHEECYVDKNYINRNGDGYTFL